MIKLLYRTFIISLISGALVTQSFAQVGVSGRVDVSAPPVAAEGTVVTNADGSRQVTNTKTIKGYKEETSMLSSVTMAGVGLVASRLYKYQPMTMDVMAAAAGGAAFIVGEVMSSKDVNDETMKIVTKTDGTTDNTQVATLEKMKASLEKAKKGTETKKKIQTVAALAFGAATGIAAYQAFTLSSSMTACASAFTADATYHTGLATQYASNEATIALAPPETALAAACTGSIPVVTGFATVLNAPIPTPSLPNQVTTATMATAVTTSVGMCQGPSSAAACPIALSNYKLFTTASVPISVAFNESTFGRRLFTQMLMTEKPTQEYIFESMLNFLLPRAEAGTTELLFGAGGVAAGLLLSSSLGVMVDTFMFTPLRRGMVWGVLAGLSFAAAQGSQANIDKLKEQISQIDGIIASLKANGTGASGNAVGVSTVIGKTFGTSGGGFLASTPDGSNVPCLLGPGNTQCPSLANALLKSPGYTTLPADIQNTGSMLGKTMDQIQGQSGITRDAMGAADVANGTSGKLQGAIASARKNLNSQLVKMGQPAVDFNKVQDNLLNQLNKTTQDALNKSGTTPSKFLASTGMSALSTSAKPTDAKAAIAKTSFAKAVGGKPATASAPAASKSGSFNFNDSASQPATEAAPEVASADVNAKYEFGANDINSDSSASIFNLISERYFKSGYPKLLDVSSEPVKK